MCEFTLLKKHISPTFYDTKNLSKKSLNLIYKFANFYLVLVFQKFAFMIVLPITDN
jgi:hypothetical protein